VKELSWKEEIDPKKLKIIEFLSKRYSQRMEDDEAGFMSKDDMGMIESQVKGELEYYKKKNKKK
jgi:hypothetical protein